MIRASLDQVRSDLEAEDSPAASLEEIEMQLVQFRDLMTSFKLFPDPLSSEQGEDRW